MANIYKAGGGGRKRRGFKGSKIPESQAILQQTKTTLQGMQTVKDHLKEQRREEYQSLKGGQRLTERQANINTRQAEQNDRILREAHVKQYRTEVLSGQAKAARITYDQQQRKELMNLIKQVPETISQVNQLRMQKAAKWVAAKDLMTDLGPDVLKDYFGNVETLRNSHDAMEEFISSKNLTGTQAETLRKTTGYRAVIVQGNILRENVKNPIYIANNEKAYREKLKGSDRLREIEIAEGNKAKGGGAFTEENAKTLAAYQRQVRQHLYEDLVGKYTGDFIKHNARDIINENHGLNLESIHQAAEENADARSAAGKSEMISNFYSGTDNVRKPDSLSTDPDTKKPYPSPYSALIKPGDIAQNVEDFDRITTEGATTGSIPTGKGKKMEFGLTQLYYLGEQDVEINGKVRKYKDLYPEKMKTWEKLVLRRLDHNDKARAGRIFEGAEMLKAQILNGAITSEKQAYGYIEKEAAKAGGMGQDERYKAYNSALGFLRKEKLPGGTGEALWNGSTRGMSPYRANANGIQMTPDRQKVAVGLTDLSQSEVNKELNAFIKQTAIWGNNKTDWSKKGFTPSIESTLVSEKVERMMFGEIKELLMHPESTLTGPQAAAQVLKKYELMKEKGEGIFALETDADGKVLLHDGRKYKYSTNTQIEDSQILRDLSENKALIFSDGFLPDRVVNGLVRHIKYGDAKPPMLAAVARQYPQLSEAEVAATMIFHNAPESGLVDKDGSMILPGYIGIIKSSMPSDEQKRILNDGTPSGTVAMSITNKNYSGVWNLSEQETSVFLAEAYINPTVGATYETSDERWNSLVTTDGLHQSNESILGKNLYDTTVGEILQMDYFKLASDTGAPDVMRSLTEGTISLDSYLSKEVQAKIFSDKIAYDSGKFQIEDMFEAIPVGQERFPSTAWAFDQQPSFRRDVRMEWEKDIETIKQTAKTLSKVGPALGKVAQKVRDPFNITTPGGLKDKYTAMQERYETQHKQYLEDVKKNKAISAKQKRQLKDMWDYLVRPDTQEAVDSISNILMTDYGIDFNNFDPSFSKDLLNKL